MFGEFDLDGFIGEAADHYAAKRPRGADNAGSKMERAMTRVARDFQVRDRIQRQRAPKMTVREETSIWTPRG